MWKEYNRLFKEHLARLTAAGVPPDEARQQAKAAARAEIERLNQQRKAPA